MATSETLRNAPLPAAWRQPLLGLALAVAAVLAVYRETVESMTAIWARSDTYAHCWFVPLIVLWLVWRRRAAWLALAPRPNAWMLLPIALTALAWLLGDLAALNSVTQAAVVTQIVLAVPALLGWAVARTILFPLAFLYFAVPIGDFLLPQLMIWTADFTTLALRATGVPVFREGMQIVIPTGHWSVVEACSGVRYLIASFMAGSLFAYLHYETARRRWAFVGFAIALPIVANWARAYLIVLIGHLSNNRLAVGADHLIYGWVFFGLVMALMFAIGLAWSEPGGVATSSVPATAGARVRPALAWLVTAGIALLVLAPQLVLSRVQPLDGEATLQIDRPAQLADGWQPSTDTLTTWKPAYREPNAELNATYRRGEREVGVYLGYYRAQSYGRKLVSSDNELVHSNDLVWAVLTPAHSVTLASPGAPLTVRSSALRSLGAGGVAGEQLAVWQLYWSGDRLTAADRWATLYGAIDRLFGRGDDGAVILLYTRLEQPGGAPAALDAFARANLDTIVTQLRKTRDGLQTRLASNQRLKGATP